MGGTCSMHWEMGSVCNILVINMKIESTLGCQ
jgi:hypothetical protein